MPEWTNLGIAGAALFLVYVLMRPMIQAHVKYLGKLGRSFETHVDSDERREVAVERNQTAFLAVLVEMKNGMAESVAFMRDLRELLKIDLLEAQARYAALRGGRHPTTKEIVRGDVRAPERGGGSPV